MDISEHLFMKRAFSKENSPEKDATVSLEFKEECGMTACYVDGFCPDGFFGACSMTLSKIETDSNPYVAIQNHSDFWCRPFFGTDFSKLPDKVQELLIYDHGTWKCYLPVCDSVYKTIIRGCRDGFEFRIYNNCDGIKVCDHQLSFLYGEGKDVYTLLHDLAKAAAKLLHNGLKMREEREYPDVLNYFGWCSWDAMQIRVNEDGLAQKAKEFAEKKIPVHFAMIDDMWADVPHLNEIPQGVPFTDMVLEMYQSKMRSFAGDPKRFPNGMKHAIERLKSEGIPHVGIWFPTTGYWNGLDPDGAVATEFTDCLIKTNGKHWRERMIVAPEEEKAHRLFSHFCGKVAEWGGDFVKIDNQGFHHRYEDVRPIGESARAIQNAIDRSVEDLLGGAVINCMGMPSECMFNRKQSAVSRCSDDFIPENRTWFAKNVLQCAYNGLLQGQYYYNDWDMWWTDDAQAVRNSVCRAISGGPVYVSDPIGRTKPDVLKPLMLSDGKLLRCDKSAVPTPDCLVENPVESKKPFKIWNRVGENIVVAVFNLNGKNEKVCGSFSPEELGFAGGEYGFFEFFTKVNGIVRSDDAVKLELPSNDDFALYTFAPVKDGIAVMGRLDKYIGIGAVEKYEDHTVTLAEGGRFGIISNRSIEIQVNGSTKPIRRNHALLWVELDDKEKTVCITG